MENQRLRLALFVACFVVVTTGSTIKQHTDEASSRHLEETLRGILEELSETERETADLKKTESHRSEENVARNFLSEFNRPSERTLKALGDIEQLGTDTEPIDLLIRRLLSDDPLSRDLENLDVFLRQRRNTDPNCGLVMDCSRDNPIVTNDDGSILVEYRRANGSCNNVQTASSAQWGMAGIQHKRRLPFDYDRGDWGARRDSVLSDRRNRIPLPDARAISEAVHRHLPSEGTPDETTPMENTVSSAVYSWGQFVDHDMMRTPEGPGRTDCCQPGNENRGFCMGIVIPPGDSFFTDGICMPAKRSATVQTCDQRFRNQLNDVTAFIDGSQLYGSSIDEQMGLRSQIGGHLKTSTRRFPPEDTSNTPVACEETGEDGDICFKTGDTRANVASQLTTLHTLFLREHNRIARFLGKERPTWTDERLFQETRKIVGAEMAAITYNEWLPAILAPDTMTQYGLTAESGYDYQPDTNPSIDSSFSIALRFGHSMVPKRMTFLDEQMSVVETADTSDTLLHPSYLNHRNYGALDEMGRWITGTKCPMHDRFIEGEVRNLLFKTFDLATLNILRAREWGVPPYPIIREHCGLSEVTDDWNSLIDHDDETIGALSSVYRDPRDIDSYTGLISERPVDGSLLGPTLNCFMGEQFHELKYGDRFWFETDDLQVGFTAAQLNEVRKTSLARVLCDNLDIMEVQRHAFVAEETRQDCDSLPEIDLGVWG